MSTEVKEAIEPMSQGRAFSIEVSERVRRLPPYLFAQLNRLKYEKRRAGDDVIDLGMGNPSDPPQDLVIEKLAEAARDPKNHGYSEAAGILSLRREVAGKYFRQHGVRLDPQRELIVCLGSKEGFSHLCLALLGPGRHGDRAGAVLSGPSLCRGAGLGQRDPAGSDRSGKASGERRLHLPPHGAAAEAADRQLSAQSVDDGVEPEFYVDAVRLAKRYGLMIISDLAYADVAFDGYKTPSFLAAPGGIDVGVEFTTMSKGYNMAGWRVGFCGGNAEMVRALATIKTYYDYGMFRPIQIAAIMALRNAEAAVEAQAAIYQHRRDVLCDGLERLGWPIDRPRASMFVWAKIPEPWASEMNTFEFAMKLLEGGRRGRQSRQRVRPGRRRLFAAGPGGKRKPPAAGRAADRAVFGEVGGGRVHDVVQAGWALSASHARSSMTESDWLRSVHADSMLSFSDGQDE